MTLVRLLALNPDRYSLGLAYLEAGLTATFGSAVRVEQCIYDLAAVQRREIDLATLAAQVADGVPQVIGLSWYCWNHRMMQGLAAVLAALAPNATIVVGGPEAGTLDDAELEEFPVGTTFVIGEGESVLSRLLTRTLEAGVAPGSDAVLHDLLPGTAVRGPDGIVRAPRPAHSIATADIPSPVLNGTLLPASTDWLPSYTTTRGCVFSCSYCGWQDGLREREFPLNRVLSELDVLKEHALDRIWFTDTIFGRNPARSIEILRKLKGWPGNTRFAFELHAHYLSAELIDALAEVPLAWAAIGVQTLAPDALKLTRRSPHTDELLEAVDRLYGRLPDRSAIHLDVIFGLPGQTLDDCFDTVDVLLMSYPEATIFAGVLQLLPGTALEKLRHELGWVALPPEFDSEVAATPHIDMDGMSRVRDLSTGLDAHVLRQDRTAIPTARDLEQLGYSLRSSAFGKHPTYGRRERFTASDVAAALTGG